MTSEAGHPSAELSPRSYPAMAAAEHRIEPCPRRIRGIVDGETVLDTSRALYVWEWPGYPQYYIPPPTCAAPSSVQGRPADGPGPTGTVRFDWDALDAWFEEDEQIFVHPRNPYTRVDALRSTDTSGSRSTASSWPSPARRSCSSRPACRRATTLRSRPSVGTPPSDRLADVVSLQGDHDDLLVRRGRRPHADLAWCYDFPSGRARSPGLVAFYNEKVDLVLDGRRLEPVGPAPQPPFAITRR